MPFGFHLAMDTLPSGFASGGFRSALAVSDFRLCARLARISTQRNSCGLAPATFKFLGRLLHTFHFSGQRGFQPRFRIRRSSSERRRDFNPPEQRAAQHASWSYPRLVAYSFLGLSEWAKG
jgi:hypothetical protein